MSHVKSSIASLQNYKFQLFSTSAQAAKDCLPEFSYDDASESLTGKETCLTRYADLKGNDKSGQVTKDHHQAAAELDRGERGQM